MACACAGVCVLQARRSCAASVLLGQHPHSNVVCGECCGARGAVVRCRCLSRSNMTAVLDIGAALTRLGLVGAL